MIRARLNKGLVSGTMSMRSTFDDERIKYKYPESCCYCGSKNNIQIDHLIPQIKGGQDSADNLVWACRSCNRSKRDRDVIVWLKSKGKEPSILLLRRYLKLVTKYCEQNQLLDLPLTEVATMKLPFQIMALPYKLENIEHRVLWVEPKENRHAKGELQPIASADRQPAIWLVCG